VAAWSSADILPRWTSEEKKASKTLIQFIKLAANYQAQGRLQSWTVGAFINERNQ
jgi:hypothetical protein